VDEVGEAEAGSGAALSALGAETILLGEGEPEVREVARYPGPSHLLVADAATPMVEGMELTERLRTQRPDIKTLYFSAAPPTLTDGLRAPDRRMPSAPPIAGG
jgi:hypothetical protein